MPPSTTVRQTPGGIMLENGHSSKIAFAADPDVSFWEIETGAPGIDGGEAIEIVTHHNVTWRGMAPRTLKTLMPFTVVAGYDPAIMSQAVTLINVETSVTDTYPDGSTYDYFGFLQRIEFDPLVEGEVPRCTVTICPTNRDPTTGAEADPVLTSVAGT